MRNRIFLRTAALLATIATPLLAGGPAPVPEPGTMVLMGVGTIALVLIARRKRKK